MVTAKQVINSTKPKIIKVPSGPTQLGSAGYDNPRDDIEKVKKIREGSVEKVPALDNDITNKKYVDDETAKYLLLNGSNANSNIDIGAYDLTTTGDISSSELNITDKITFTNSDDISIKKIDSAQLYFEHQISGKEIRVSVSTKDADGTDRCGYDIYGYGSASSQTNRHRLIERWNPAGYYEIFTEYAGTQTGKELKLFTEGNTGQLVLAINGNISMSEDLDVVGSSTGGTLHADNGWSGTFTNGDADTVTVVDGIITDVGN